VPEISKTRLHVTGIYASVEALDRLRGGFRVAPDELLILGSTPDLKTLADSDGIVLDTTDGWAVWSLSGEGAHETFSYLSELRLPAAGDGFVQGDVMHVPAKVVVEGETIHILIPAMWGDYLGERIREVIER
jgi:hypothetical protein